MSAHSTSRRWRRLLVVTLASLLTLSILPVLPASAVGSGFRLNLLAGDNQTIPADAPFFVEHGYTADLPDACAGGVPDVALIEATIRPVELTVDGVPRQPDRLLPICAPIHDDGTPELFPFLLTRFVFPAGLPMGEHTLAVAFYDGDDLAFSAEVTVTATELDPFSDVVETSAHARAIAAIAAAGITTGYPDGTFRPNVDIQRAQMATFLTQAFSLTGAGQPLFPDVDPYSTHAQAIASIAAEGITTGYPDGTFRPSQPVTRGQMASFLARALDLPSVPLASFTDVPATSAHAQAIAAIAAEGITTGYPDGTFRPDRFVSRGQMASFLARALGLVAPAELLACLVTDPGGIADGSFNQTAYAGLVEAWTQLPIDIAVREAGDDDLSSGIAASVAQGCELIITVGFVMDDATRAAASAHPDRAFAIIDAGIGASQPNLRALSFAVEEAAFLAGYVAAGVTDTGIVGTYGGLDIPPVTAFMDGFLAGVRYHNTTEGTTVEVLGWDGSSGLFAGTFVDETASRGIAAGLLDDGADVLLPVLGPAGRGAGAAIDAHGSGRLVWVDTDGFLTVPEYRSILLTSVLKRMDIAVFDTVLDVLDGTFTGGERLGTLGNDGVGIAPFHDLADEVPATVSDALDEVIGGIIDGSISVDPADH